mgnify:CR=1 FL=1
MPSDWKLLDSEIKAPFASFAFRNDTTGEIIVAYRGTDGLSYLAANSKILVGGWDSQFKQGMDFLARIRTYDKAFPEGYVSRSCWSASFITTDCQRDG